MDPQSLEFEAFELVLAEHRELKGLLGKIDQVLAQRTATVAEISDLLAQLGDRLVKHFATEEDGSYFGEALLHAPQLVSKANELLAQHPKMRLQANHMLLQIKTSSENEDWWQRTRQLFLEFRTELLRHENREDRMLQEAYGQDLGSHD
ncbi:MAG: hemerythrin domain-containing protein [Thermoguttaceae bacterium]